VKKLTKIIILFVLILSVVDLAYISSVNAQQIEIIGNFEDNLNSNVINLQKEILSFNNNTGSVNSSDFWLTDEGNLDNVPDLYPTLDDKYCELDGCVLSGNLNLTDGNSLNIEATSQSEIIKFTNIPTLSSSSVGLAWSDALSSRLFIGSSTLGTTIFDQTLRGINISILNGDFKVFSDSVFHGVVNVTEDIISDGQFIGDGSVLTGVIHSITNIFNQDLNTTNSPQFVDLNLTDGNIYLNNSILSNSDNYTGSGFKGIVISDSLFSEGIVYTGGRRYGSYTTTLYASIDGGISAFGDSFLPMRWYSGGITSQAMDATHGIPLFSSGQVQAIATSGVFGNGDTMAVEIMQGAISTPVATYNILGTGSYENYVQTYSVSDDKSFDVANDNLWFRLHLGVNDDADDVSIAVKVSYDQ
jgi:hypothetical protein